MNHHDGSIIPASRRWEEQTKRKQENDFDIINDMVETKIYDLKRQFHSLFEVQLIIKHALLAVMSCFLAAWLIWLILKKIKDLLKFDNSWNMLN